MLATVPARVRGIELPPFDPLNLRAAELLGELAFNDRLRTRVIDGQRRRLAAFGEARLHHDLTRLLSMVH